MDLAWQKRRKNSVKQIASRSLILIFVLLVLSISMASAFSLKDFFNKISGKATFPSGNNCTDTDSSDYYTKGFVSGNEWGRAFDYTDQCFTDNILREYYCASTGEASAKQYTCTYGCRDGACLTQNECTDPDSSDYYTQQVSYSIEFGRPFRYVDECYNSSDLMEYYCASTIEMSLRIYPCPYGCLEGKCKIASCSDTDAGADYSVQGSLVESKESGIIERTDECVNSTALREYYCADASSGEGTARIYDCPYGCEDGKCKIASCSDSDNGSNDTMQGTTTEFKGGGRTDFIDECATSSILREYYCASTGEASARQYDCYYGCKEGACLTQNECIDTDHGTAYNTRGRTYGFEFGRMFEYIDECVTDTLVRKYYCTSGQPTALAYDCPYGCREGVCIIQDCTDSDNGENYYVSGITNSTLYGVETSFIDQCTDVNTLEEYSCSITGEINSTAYDCASGCSNGACLNTCNETDQGENYNHKGGIYGMQGDVEFNYTDYCITNNTLREYYCASDSTTVQYDYDCLGGCGNGACRDECVDSDEGRIYGEAGAVYKLSTAEIFRDECALKPWYERLAFWLPAYTLTENYCDGDERAFEEVPCNSCVNGACID